MNERMNTINPYKCEFNDIGTSNCILETHEKNLSPP